MENNLENKAKFFAQYWGQKVLRYSVWIDGIQNRLCTFEFATAAMYIELKPLSSITDEDAAVIHYGHTANDVKNYYGGDWKRAEQKQEIKDIDYLRSKGYAIPYMGLSIETMIEYGWIKLIE